ncbi:cytochrome P450 [Mameliella alba]|uniref:cytochrome P450 n=1 Tax=Mameliella alba TaxID=561184 RepID=UPI000B537A22|nr:cytochrome P450 [Mameliella alba]MBY6117532.1 cytochrome P450 [Mameliella alba]OWV39493.1 cytochrome [Mameliella alba]OWV64924.1 cytochrome [Mameliella alba]
MSDAPRVDLDPAELVADPYPSLARLQAETPIAFVPQLGATLITRRNVIFEQEKRIEVFSSRQPQGLMTRLMGENMMRKDGEAHAAERRACFPSYSPRTVRDRWSDAFRTAACAALEDMARQGQCDLVPDYAMRLSGEALRAITGLHGLTWQEMDAVSQGMIDGIANYTGDPEVEARCHAATARIDAAIDAQAGDPPEMSLLDVQVRAGLPMDSVRANIKLAISGGQNEPRDAIAGCAWALLAHPAELARVRRGEASWQDAFEEFARWIAPIGMSPREVAWEDVVEGVRFDPGDRVFLMYGIGNRDPEVFDRPEVFDVTRDTRPSLAFGAGPHFCAGAAASRSLIAEVALPMLFERFPGMELAGPVAFTGWAFRGPKSVPVRLGGAV